MVSSAVMKRTAPHRYGRDWSQRVKAQEWRWAQDQLSMEEKTEEQPFFILTAVLAQHE